MIVEWSIRCDQPGCPARITTARETDAAARRACVAEALRMGWLVGPYGEDSLDFCRTHNPNVEHEP